MLVHEIDLAEPRQRQAARDLDVLAAAIAQSDKDAITYVVAHCDITAMLIIAVNDLNRLALLQKFLDTPFSPAVQCRCAILHTSYRAHQEPRPKTPPVKTPKKRGRPPLFPVKEQT